MPANSNKTKSANLSEIIEGLLEHTVEIEFRGHMIHVLGIKKLIELKKNSKDSKDKQRLPVLEETLRQLEKKSGSNHE